MASLGGKNLPRKAPPEPHDDSLHYLCRVPGDGCIQYGGNGNAYGSGKA